MWNRILKHLFNLLKIFTVFATVTFEKLAFGEEQQMIKVAWLLKQIAVYQAFSFSMEKNTEREWEEEKQHTIANTQYTEHLMKLSSQHFTWTSEQ